MREEFFPMRGQDFGERRIGITNQLCIFLELKVAISVNKKEGGVQQCIAVHTQQKLGTSSILTVGGNEKNKKP